jgi:diguanylate cyclase (GGDEF)-like protein
VSSLRILNLEADGTALFWAWFLATLVLATGLGFLAGLAQANRSADRGMRKAVNKLSSLYSLAIESLEKAQQIAVLLEKFPQVELSNEQVERLDAKRGSLLETVGRFVGAQREALTKKIAVTLKPAAQPLKVSWQRNSLDAATGLPDRAGLNANLQLMLAAGAKSGGSSAVLLAKIDRLDQLKGRFGIQGADSFVKTMAAVIARAVREQDLVCRTGTDSFAVLIPGVDADAGRKLAQAVRNSVRVHTFRLQDGGPEVLVTASFGSTMAPPDDDANLALSRAEDALEQSIRRGRNQLHFVDGQSPVHCAAG